MSIKKLTSAVKVETAKDNPGQLMSPEKMIGELIPSLDSVLGPLKASPVFKSLGSSRLFNRMFSAKPMMGKQVNRMLESLDFTSMAYKSVGAFGGSRLEVDGRSTVVNYCAFSGVLVVSSSIAELRIVQAKISRVKSR